MIVADDHDLVRQGIRLLLEQSADITVLAEARDGAEAVSQVEIHNPDVLLLDLSMKRLNGIQTAEQIRHRGRSTRIVMLSMHSDKHLIQQALRAGVNGYLLKNAVQDELLRAVHAVHKGHSYFSPEISHILASNFVADQDEALPTELSALYDLTEREREVLKLVAEGHTNQDVADLLQLSVKTIQKHRANLMAKLEVHNLAGLTKAALKYGLISIE